MPCCKTKCPIKLYLSESSQTVISEPGHYEVTGGVTMTVAGESAIKIASSNVTLDLCSTVIDLNNIVRIGILVDGNYSNVTIRNGTITRSMKDPEPFPMLNPPLAPTFGFWGNPYYSGILIKDSLGPTFLEDLTLDRNDGEGFTLFGSSNVEHSNCKSLKTFGRGFYATNIGDPTDLLQIKQENILYSNCLSVDSGYCIMVGHRFDRLVVVPPLLPPSPRTLRVGPSGRIRNVQLLNCQTYRSMRDSFILFNIVNLVVQDSVASNSPFQGGLTIVGSSNVSVRGHVGADNDQDSITLTGSPGFPGLLPLAIPWENVVVENSVGLRCRRAGMLVIPNQFTNPAGTPPPAFRNPPTVSIIQAPSRHLVVRNCTFSFNGTNVPANPINVPGSGFACIGGDGIVLQNVVAEHNYQRGIYIVAESATPGPLNPNKLISPAPTSGLNKNLIEGCTVQNNGFDINPTNDPTYGVLQPYPHGGIEVRGNGFLIQNNTVSGQGRLLGANNGPGYYVLGDDNILLHNVSVCNGGDGFKLVGTGNILETVGEFANYEKMNNNLF